MKKVIVIGCIGFDSTIAIASAIAQRLNSNDNVVTAVNDVEAKNVINQQFQPEPLIFREYKTELLSTKIKEFPKNKFIDKPKFNHRKK